MLQLVIETRLQYKFSIVLNGCLEVTLLRLLSLHLVNVVNVFLLNIEWHQTSYHFLRIKKSY